MQRSTALGLALSSVLLVPPSGGSVTPFGIANDRGGAVRVALDTGLKDHEVWNFHPLDNGMTTRLAGDDMVRFLEAEGVARELVFLGFDVSPSRLATAGERSEWHLCRGTLLSPLPYATASVDICICEQVIEHLDDPALVLREIGRVVRPDGLLVLGVPSFPAPVIPLHRRLTRLRRRWLPDGHFHLQSFSARTLRAAVERVGFSVRDLRGFRVTSGGLMRPLEQRAWWYRANRRFGARFPGLCTEVQVLATRDA